MKGFFSAQATRAIDAYSRLKVRISDDTDMNIKLQDATREFMSNAGFNIDSKNPTSVRLLRTSRP